MSTKRQSRTKSKKRETLISLTIVSKEGRMKVANGGKLVQGHLLNLPGAGAGIIPRRGY